MFFNFVVLPWAVVVQWHPWYSYENMNIESMTKSSRLLVKYRFIHHQYFIILSCVWISTAHCAANCWDIWSWRTCVCCKLPTYCAHTWPTSLKWNWTTNLRHAVERERSEDVRYTSFTANAQATKSIIQNRNHKVRTDLTSPPLPQGKSIWVTWIRSAMDGEDDDDDASTAATYEWRR